MSVSTDSSETDRAVPPPSAAVPPSPSILRRPHDAYGQNSTSPARRANKGISFVGGGGSDGDQNSVGGTTPSHLTRFGDTGVPSAIPETESEEGGNGTLAGQLEPTSVSAGAYNASTSATPPLFNRLGGGTHATGPSLDLYLSGRSSASDVVAIHPSAG